MTTLRSRSPRYLSPTDPGPFRRPDRKPDRAVWENSVENSVHERQRRMNNRSTYQNSIISEANKLTAAPT